MGEAQYYIKAENCSDETFEKVKQFFIEGSNAEDWWQDNRHMNDDKKFWSEFEKNFPLVAKYAKFVGIFGKDCNNEPAGKINFGSLDDIEDNMQCDGDEFSYDACIWHFASWNGLAKFLKSEFGLERVRWISDEDVNPYDLL